MKDIIALILAAGKGTRMKSSMPKVLHKVGGVPMVEQVLRAVKAAGTQRQVVVVGFGGEAVQEYLGDRAETVVQEQQLGTGHAVMQAEPLLSGLSGTLLVTCGDTPLVTEDTFRSLLAHHEDTQAAATVLTAVMPDPTGYGRVIRNEKGQVVKIVEQKDGSPEELAVREVNAGIYCFDMELLWQMLHNVTNNNAQGEYYLTDIIGMLVDAGKVVSAFAAPDYKETLGVNSRLQMAEAEQVLTQFAQSPLFAELAACKTLACEMPFSFLTEEGLVESGVMDAVLECPDGSIWVADYKTDNIRPGAEAATLDAKYRPQLSVYQQAARRLFPDQKVRCSAVFVRTFAAADL